MHVLALFFVVLACAAGEPPPPDQADGAIHARLAAWTQSIGKQDHAAYAACFLPNQAPADYVSREAFAFWSRQVKSLEGKGFAGAFLLVPATADDLGRATASFPGTEAGDLRRAAPILKAGPAREWLLLLRRQGAWYVVAMF